MTKEDKRIYSLFNKVFDYFINKEANASEIEQKTKKTKLTLKDVNNELQTAKDLLNKLKTAETKEKEEKPPEGEKSPRRKGYMEELGRDDFGRRN